MKNTTLILYLLLFFYSSNIIAQVGGGNTCDNCNNAVTNSNLALNNVNFSQDCNTVTINYPFISAVCEDVDAIEIDWIPENPFFTADVSIETGESVSFEYPTSGTFGLRVRVVRDGIVCSNSVVIRQINISCQCFDLDCQNIGQNILDSIELIDPSTNCGIFQGFIPPGTSECFGISISSSFLNVTNQLNDGFFTIGGLFLNFVLQLRDPITNEILCELEGNTWSTCRTNITKNGYLSLEKNPFKNSININSPERSKIISVLLYSGQGVKIMEKEQLKIENVDLSFLTPDLYFIKVIYENGSFEIIKGLKK